MCVFVRMGLKLFLRIIRGCLGVGGDIKEGLNAGRRGEEETQEEEKEEERKSNDVVLCNSREMKLLLLLPVLLVALVLHLLLLKLCLFASQKRSSWCNGTKPEPHSPVLTLGFFLPMQPPPPFSASTLFLFIHEPTTLTLFLFIHIPATLALFCSSMYLPFFTPFMFIHVPTTLYTFYVHPCTYYSYPFSVHPCTYYSVPPRSLSLLPELFFFYPCPTLLFSRAFLLLSNFFTTLLFFSACHLLSTLLDGWMEGWMDG